MQKATYRATDGSGNKADVITLIPAGAKMAIHTLWISIGPSLADLVYVGDFADHALAVRVAERFLGCDVVLPGCSSWY